MSDIAPPENASPSLRPDRQGVTLVLGGGGFKGMAHVGVFLALEEHGIPVRSIIGTSAGALLGACYAHLMDARAVQDHVLQFLNSEEFQRKGFVSFEDSSKGNGVGSFLSRVVSGIKRQVALERMFRRNSAFGGAALRFVVRGLLPNLDFQDLSLPVAIAALDIASGEEVLITEGPIRSAVCASSSVPGFFPPVDRDGRLLVDAGIVDNLPTRLARSLGAMRIVAVDLSAGLAPIPPGEVGMSLLLRAQDISTRIANRARGGFADVVLKPELDGRSWLDPEQPADVMDAGYRAAIQAMDDIRDLLGAPS